MLPSCRAKRCADAVVIVIVSTMKANMEERIVEVSVRSESP